MLAQLLAPLFSTDSPQQERPTSTQRFVGLFIGFVGVILISLLKVLDPSSSSSTVAQAVFGYLVCVIGTACKSFAALYVQRFEPSAPVLRLAWGQTMLGAVFATSGNTFVVPSRVEIISKSRFLMT